MKTFNTQVCTTKEQSQRLLELGLKKETADMCYSYTNYCSGDEILFTCVPDVWHEDVQPRWSLHRLLSIVGDALDLPIVMFETGKRVREVGHSYCYEEVIQFIDDAIREGYLNEEYLEE